MNQTSYRKQMDAVQLSKEKADETLRLMLEENHRLQQKEREEKAAKYSRLKIPSFALAAAACLAIMFLFTGRFSGKTAFLTVKISELPTASISRGDDEKTVAFQDAFGCSPDTLFPGWTVTEESTAVFTLQGNQAYESRMVLTNGDTALSATVTDYEPPLFTLLQKESKPISGSVYLAKDEKTGVLYAVYTAEGRYFVLSSSDMTEAAFQKVIEEEI